PGLALLSFSWQRVTTFRNYLYSTVSMVYGQFPKSMVRFARSICQDGNKWACGSFWFLNSAANWEDKMWRGEPKSLNFSGRIDVKLFRIIKSTNRNRSEISGSWERKPGVRLKQATLRSHAVCFL